VLTIGYLVLETDRVDIVTAQGRRIPAAVAGHDHQTGFGLVRALVPLGIQPIDLGDSDAIAERSRVLTLGQGENEITELMVVSRKPFSGSWEYLLERPFYTFPPVNNWSGAALFGRDGKLIGIGSMVVQDAASDRAGVPGNLYVPVNLLKPILSDLQAKGRRSEDAQPWLGINTESLHGNLMVTRVQRGSPAEQAGLNRGAVILAVGGQPVADLETLYRAIRTAGPAGSALAFRVLQQGTVREIEIRSMDRADFIARRERGRGI
jgi:S1-C subfamily serine protease